MRRTVATFPAIVLSLPIVTLNSGRDETSKSLFREAAAGGLADGLKAMLSSLVDGLQVVME